MKHPFLMLMGALVCASSSLHAEPYLLWRSTSGNNHLYQMQGATIAQSYALNSIKDTLWKVAGIGDFDGDGHDDVLWRHQTSGENYIHFIQDGQFRESLRVNKVPTSDWIVAAVADLNGDGKADLVWRNTKNGANYAYLMNGHLISQSTQINTVTDQNWQIKGAGDFDGDGKEDLLWRNVQTGVNFVYLMNGTSIASSKLINTVKDLSWTVAGVADFNQDGRADIVWRHASSGLNYMYLMNGTSIQEAKVINTVASSAWQLARVGDLNADGAADLVWRHQQTGANYVYFMQGASIQSTALINSVSPQAWQLVGLLQGQSKVEPCISDVSFFTEQVQPILTDCVACHISGGVAGEQLTDLQFQPTTQSGYLAHNFTELGDFALQTSPKNGETLLLSKPRGINHVGGQRWGMTTETAEFLALQAMIARYKSPTQCDGEVKAVPLFTDVSFLSNEQVLTKAAMLFAAKRPSAAQLDQARTGSDATLKSLIRSFMQGDNFKKFIIEGANNQLLTDKYLNNSSPGLNVISEWYYPNSHDRIEEVQQNNPEDYGNAWWQSSLAVAREPLQLFAYVVDQEKPYTEVLTADYILVNYWSDAVYSAGAGLTDPSATDVWKVGKHNGHRLGFYPRSGILNSPIFLNRYPSTATNRNRARARWTYQFFLGVDIEALAQRPTDPDALKDTNNPTMNNPNCAVCHSVMDPVAGTFQNYGDDGYFLDNDIDSLPWTYKASDLFVEGDRWYRDMRSPGFAGALLPSAERDGSIRWLAHQIINDPRFGTGAVKFWWQAVFGQDVLREPTQTSDTDYAQKRQAYEDQQALIAQLAQDFVQGSAGTAAHGAYNVKDLLVDMVMTPWFRATDVTSSAGRESALANVGHSRLLTPEQLSRKVEAVTGFAWGPNWDPQGRYLERDYLTFYGGIDSDGLTERVEDMNSLMTTVVERMANEMACRVTAFDFVKNKAERHLFPRVEVSDTPDTSAGEQAILANIQYLHQQLLGESLALNDPEVLRTYQLFKDIRAMRIANNRGINIGWGDGHCSVDWDNLNTWLQQDPEQTARSWMAVLVYMFNDYRFLHL